MDGDMLRSSSSDDSDANDSEKDDEEPEKSSSDASDADDMELEEDVKEPEEVDKEPEKVEKEPEEEPEKKPTELAAETGIEEAKGVVVRLLSGMHKNMTVVATVHDVADEPRKVTLSSSRARAASASTRRTSGRA